MKLKIKLRFWGLAFVIMALFGVINTVLAYSIRPVLFWPCLILNGLLLAGAGVYYAVLRRGITDLYRTAASHLDPSDAGLLAVFPMPAVVTDAQDHILWYNGLFTQEVTGGQEVQTEHLTELLGGFKPSYSDRISDYHVTFGQKEFTAFSARFCRNDQTYFAYYFINDTKQKQLVRQYYETRPAVMIIGIDNLDEAFGNLKESEKITLLAGIEAKLEAFVSNANGFLAKVDRDRMIAVMEETYISRIIDEKFPILDAVRKADEHLNNPVTLSIGVGKGGKSFAEDEQFARQALDMAMGRGGDQAAVRNQEGYSFFGGVSKGVEKRSQIKTRIMASAISELLERAENVLVMGHKASDLDCLAAGTVMAQTALHYGKNAHVVLRKQESLAGNLLEKLAKNGNEGLYITPEEAQRHVTKGTLLIVVDTHNTASVESPQLLENCKDVVVIDHHRKMVNYIDKAVIFYHEPFASSASEMVAELCQYFRADHPLTQLEADALLSGMMLDTKNFSMGTGVRTFEAAAYLKSRGADTGRVKRLFVSQMDAYAKKTAMVTGAQMYQKCAICENPEDTPHAMMISAQAADDLLSIEGVRAAFAIYYNDGAVCISARSFGDLNVQLIMEALGGGGHQTMSGTRFASEVTMAQAKQQLKEAIDAQLANQA